MRQTAETRRTHIDAQWTAHKKTHVVLDRAESRLLQVDTPILDARQCAGFEIRPTKENRPMAPSIRPKALDWVCVSTEGPDPISWLTGPLKLKLRLSEGRVRTLRI